MSLRPPLSEERVVALVVVGARRPDILLQQVGVPRTRLGLLAFTDLSRERSCNALELEES